MNNEITISKIGNDEWSFCENCTTRIDLYDINIYCENITLCSECMKNLKLVIDNSLEEIEKD